MAAAERWIPYRLSDLVDVLAEEVPDGDGFRELHRIVAAVVHHQFHQHLQRLKDAYAPFNRDTDSRVVRDWTDEERARSQQMLVNELTQLVEAANYEPVDRDMLGDAVEAESLLRLRLKVDFDDFEEILFFRRGTSQRTEEVRGPFGLRRREVEFTNYDRVLVYLKFKDAEHFAARGRDDLMFTPGSTIIKLFQDVPRADLEMLFPNTEVRMRTTDKVIIGVPAVVGGTALFVTKVASALGVLLLLIGGLVGLSDDDPELDQTRLAALTLALGSFFAFLWRQWSKFKNRRIQFMKTLSENLYFRNLDNDVGVFHHLLDSAEEEEVKEILLAHRFLFDGAATADDLDGRIEAWFDEQLGCRLDFEVDDALDKLVDLDLVTVDGGLYEAVSMDEAKRRLDARWDAFFTWSTATS